MKFLELVLQNFGPYQGKQIINLRNETEDMSRPIILFGGMNGGGKTTLMDSIRLALYGQRAQCSTRGNLSYMDFLTQCVNRNTPPTEKTRIELAFEVIEDDQPKKLRIVRYWEANPKEGKDTLGILDNDEWPDKALANIWDEYIENLLPIGISNLFLFDGEQVKELAEMDTPPPLVIDAIQSLLGLELADRLSKDLEILVSRKRREIANTEELSTLDEIEQKLTLQNSEFEEVKKQLVSVKNNLAEAESNYRVAQDKFIYEGGKLARDRSLLDKQKTDLSHQLDKTSNTLRELAAGVLPLALITPILEQAKLQGEQENHAQKATLTRELLKERDTRLLNYIKDLSLKTTQFEKIEKFMAQEHQNLTGELKELKKPWLRADKEALKQLENILSSEIKTATEKALEKQAEMAEIETEIVFLERQIVTAASPEAYQKLEKEVRDAQNKRWTIQSEYDSLTIRQNELENAMKTTKKELQEFTENHLKFKNYQHIITSSAKVQATLKLFQEKLTLKKLNKLENEVTECFRYLLHKSDLVHRVVIDTKTFCLSLYDPHGLTVPKHRLSAGEKQLLAIAFLWGLARVSGRHLPVAIDTPLGRLDSSHRHNLLERYFPSASHQVILLSTDTEIGENEVKNLRQNDAIAIEYLLKYDGAQRQTTVQKGYFW
jgi:DNA sulfur modification protein DndD